MENKSGETFERFVAKMLQEANIPFETQLSVGGVRPDILIETPNGNRVIVEIKSTIHNERDAIRQLEHYKQITGADDAYIVVPPTQESLPSQGIISGSELVDVLVEQWAMRRTHSGPAYPAARKADKLIFAAMPFSPDYEDAYFVAMAPASETVNAVCERVDLEKFAGDVVDKVKRLIFGSNAVIADLSEGKPNVLYEVGFAHALGRPTVHICTTPLDELPFDVRNWNTIKYVKGQTHKLKDQLIDHLKAIPGLQ